MKIDDYLATLAPSDRSRLLGQLEGLQLAQRLISDQLAELNSASGEDDAAIQQLNNAIAMIRLAQVNLGNGIARFPILDVAEQFAIDRIS
ncbi:hypothetical protein SAMN06265795_1293 [Noviherbaspirillum humi]|uniref:Uncharacterized protein n=1 Tax=Noviherbaspirillum humi TaxID=1688639 RepID=A0A239M231_9BURK|nr:hypothetical protein [Noviherbaspirillum humi]SNT36004.1 hypothetical protein SAMN06265795_1293 [Noviherbaspirillum humi]